MCRIVPALAVIALHFRSHTHIFARKTTWKSNFLANLLSSKFGVVVVVRCFPLLLVGFRAESIFKYYLSLRYGRWAPQTTVIHLRIFTYRFEYFTVARVFSLPFIVLNLDWLELLKFLLLLWSPLTGARKSSCSLLYSCHIQWDARHRGLCLFSCL